MGHPAAVGHRYLFVAGLHRSGTSLAARLAASLPGAAGIDGAPVPEQEGAYLTGALPHTAMHGRPGHFATDPAQHLVEGHPLDRLDTLLRLERDWDPWFRPDAIWRVEKSPVNLVRMRLLQSLLPLSQFVVVVRHPVAVAQAVAKWTGEDVATGVAYWEAAMAQVLGDLPYLHAALVLRYEDLVAAPGRAVERLAAFTGLPPAPPGEAVRDGNRDYDLRWPVPPGPAARALGYGEGPMSDALAVRHPLRAVREAVMATL